MEISVIVTTYNYGAYLAEALASALAQTHPPAEVIVLDDGSTDGDASARVAADYGARVRYVYQPNAGIGAARNAGAAAATGTHLAWLDGDDYWTPDKLARQAAAFAADPALEAAFTHMHQFISPEVANTSLAKELGDFAEELPGLSASTMLISRAAFERVGPFATDMAVSEFLDWYARATEQGLRTAMLPEVLAWRRLHGSNNGRRHKHARPEYARVLKAALDRRRAAAKKAADQA